jgi:hypothetical protein
MRLFEADNARASAQTRGLSVVLAVVPLAAGTNPILSGSLDDPADRKVHRDTTATSRSGPPTFIEAKPSPI